MTQREEWDVVEPRGLLIRGPDGFKEWGEQSPGATVRGQEATLQPPSPGSEDSCCC